MQKAVHLSRPYYESGEVNSLLIWLQESSAALKFFGTVISFLASYIEKQNKTNKMQTTPFKVPGIHPWESVSVSCPLPIMTPQLLQWAESFLFLWALGLEYVYMIQLWKLNHFFIMQM